MFPALSSRAETTGRAPAVLRQMARRAWPTVTPVRNGVYWTTNTHTDTHIHDSHTRGWVGSWRTAGWREVGVGRKCSGGKNIKINKKSHCPPNVCTLKIDTHATIHVYLMCYTICYSVTWNLYIRYNKYFYLYDKYYILLCKYLLCIIWRKIFPHAITLNLINLKKYCSNVKIWILLETQ